MDEFRTHETTPDDYPVLGTEAHTGHIDLLMAQIESEFYQSAMQAAHQLGIRVKTQEIANLADCLRAESLALKSRFR